MTHHKSNKAVEGDPDTGHGGGLPRRPDEAELEDRTEEDRAEVGLDPDPGDGPGEGDGEGDGDGAV
ncbi:hypothetical protein [Kitasatospora phosalacinea]|uniref:hypothetical protein n=1 Tax=Kitasatospora phosalacinea TaxID=2065 RepID=UPI000527BFCF|nr:hypothetical protein [Kitasatospora phosalacinea]